MSGLKLVVGTLFRPEILPLCIGGAKRALACGISPCCKVVYWGSR